jgi:nucleoid DNA-binding protein
MSEKTTFRELIEQIAGKTENSQNFTQDFVRELVRVIESGLKENGSVSISGFGKFELRWMKEREGTNPQSGEKITIPAQSKVVFKPFKALKDDVNRPYAKMEARILDALTEGSSEDEPEQVAPVVTAPTEQPESDIIEEPKDQPDTGGDDPFAVDESDTPSSYTPPADFLNKSTPEEKPMIEDPFSITGSEDPDDPFAVSSDENILDDDVDDENDVDDDDLFGEKVPADGHIFDEDDDVFGAESETEENEISDPIDSEQEEPAVTPISDDLSDSESEEDIPEEDEISDDEENILVVERPAPEPEPEDVFVATAESEPDETKIVEKVQEEGSLNWSYIAAGSIIMLAAVGIYSLRGFWSDSDTPVIDEADTTPQLNNAVDDVSITAPVVTSPDIVEVTVEAGQSLWQLAESTYGNGYLWPWIYYENTDKISDPNLIVEGSSLSIPIPVDADNLSLSELEKVGFGYLSVYQWVRENNPEQARYFLWAAGSFSPDVIEMASGNVDESDLAFARRR